jgi:uncharacterized membrane protein
MKSVKLAPCLFLFACACRLATPVPHSDAPANFIKFFRNVELTSADNYRWGGSGVQFRAAGLEDNWTLEVYDDRIIFSHDADGRVIVPPAPAEQADGATIYVSTSEAHRLQIVVEPRACTNLINGKRFNARVEVNLDGDGYRGCGYVR